MKPTRSRWSALVLLLLLTAGTVRAVGDPRAPAPAPRLRVLVPAYFYPAGPGADEWERMTAAAKDVPLVAIVNPASGPGKATDPNYTRVLDRALKAGVTLIGYVSTSYARVPEADARADVDTWLRLYPQVRGFFFDEQTSAAEKVPYYRALYEHARMRLKEALVVTNPGTLCAPEYLTRPATDVACLYENHTGFEEFRAPEWTRPLPRSRFYVLPYAVREPERMERYVRKALAERMGYVYVTDHQGANPWDRLPVYWKDEVALVARLNAE